MQLESRFSFLQEVSGRFGRCLCRPLLILLLGSALLAGQPCQAQSFRYMDESGNIYFVERLEDVPPKYRSQILKPTPTIDPKFKGKKKPKKKPTKKPSKKQAQGLRTKVPPQAAAPLLNPGAAVQPTVTAGSQPR